MSGKTCRGLRGFAAGGIVDVPGASRSGVADDIHVDDAPVGGFVLPADSVLALRRSNPELLAQILAAIQQAGGDADGAATAQIAISNGELFIPPEAVALLGGAEVLNAIKDATHQPVAAPAAKPIDAPPPPGGVNAPLDAVVQPPRGLPGIGGAGVLPDAAMPGSGQAQQQRTFFKGGGAVARGLFTGGGLARRAFPNGGQLTNPDEEKALESNQYMAPTPAQKAASAAHAVEVVRDAQARRAQQAETPWQQPEDPTETAAQQAGRDLAADASKVSAQVAQAQAAKPIDNYEYGKHSAELARQYNEDYAAIRAAGGGRMGILGLAARTAPMMMGTGIADAVSGAAHATGIGNFVRGLFGGADSFIDKPKQSDGGSLVKSANAAPTPASQPQQSTKPANTDAPAAQQQGGWKPTGIAGVMRRGNEYSNVPEIGADGKPTGGYVSAFAPAEIRQGAAAAAPAGLSTGAQVAGGGGAYARPPATNVAGINPNLLGDGGAAVLAAQRAAIMRGEPYELNTARGLPGIQAPAAAPTFQKTLREIADEQRIRDALLSAAADPKRLRGAKDITARQRSAQDAAQRRLLDYEKGQRDFQLAWQNAQQNAMNNAANTGLRAAELAARQQEAAQPRGLTSAGGQGVQQQPSGKDRIDALRATLMEQAAQGNGRALAVLQQLDGKGGGNGGEEWSLRDIDNSEGGKTPTLMPSAALLQRIAQETGQQPRFENGMFFILDGKGEKRFIQPGK